MKRLLESVERLCDEEYERAKEKFGPTNHSSHESFAVLLEEEEEATVENNDIVAIMQTYWTAVKTNDLTVQRECLEELRKKAKLMACESIQVSTMAYKALLSLEEEHST